MMISPVVITTSRKENNMAPVVISTSRKENNAAPVVITTSRKDSPNFTGKGSGMLIGAQKGWNKQWKNFIKNIVKPCIESVKNSKPMQKFADWTADIDKMPSHMATLGSVVTTYFYARRTKKTLNKDEEQKKRGKTLRLNQWMVTGVSTALAYGVDGALKKFSKQLGYKFRELHQGKKDLELAGKGFGVARQLLIFTLMYRFVAPVFVTPLASKISKWWELRKADKARIAEIKQKEQNSVANVQQPSATAKTIQMTPQTNTQQNATTARTVQMTPQTNTQQNTTTAKTESIKPQAFSKTA